LAKGLGGGMPLGAFIAPKSLMQLLTHDPVLGHITTFGGHPVSAAAGLATLEVLLDTDLVSLAKRKGDLFRSLLNHPEIREIRQAGLWLGVDVGSFERVQKIIAHCLHEGVVTDWFLFNNCTLRIAPPLIISEEEISLACSVINAAKA
ncbi:MAG: aminotransferase class III-fold pyridoxal phosphate-dependent enzyme, partial [Bacteroidota bacterium]